MGNLGEELMPARINAMQVISYDTQQVVQMLIDEGVEESEIDLDMVLSRIEDWSAEDFLALQPKDIIYQDENGEEL